jgi:hypothetical protein
MPPTLASSLTPLLHRRASVGMLVALLALAGVIQALAPASAGAVANQTTTCVNMPIPDVGLVPGMGWNGSFACVLDSGGAYYGGTGTTKKDPDPICPDVDACLPDGLRAGRGDAGRERGSGEVRGSRGGGTKSTLASLAAKLQEKLGLKPKAKPRVKPKPSPAPVPEPTTQVPTLLCRGLSLSLRHYSVQFVQGADKTDVFVSDLEPGIETEPNVPVERGLKVLLNRGAYRVKGLLASWRGAQCPGNPLLDPWISHPSPPKVR